MSHAVITPESVVSVGVWLPPDLGLIFAHLRPRTRTALIPTDNREPGPERLYAVLLHEYFTEWRPWRWPRIGDRSHPAIRAARTFYCTNFHPAHTRANPGQGRSTPGPQPFCSKPPAPRV